MKLVGIRVDAFAKIYTTTISNKNLPMTKCTQRLFLARIVSNKSSPFTTIICPTTINRQFSVLHDFSDHFNIKLKKEYWSQIKKQAVSKHRLLWETNQEAQPVTLTLMVFLVCCLLNLRFHRVLFLLGPKSPARKQFTRF